MTKRLITQDEIWPLSVVAFSTIGVKICWFTPPVG